MSAATIKNQSMAVVRYALQLLELGELASHGAGTFVACSLSGLRIFEVVSARSSQDSGSQLWPSSATGGTRRVPFELQPGDNSSRL